MINLLENPQTIYSVDKLSILAIIGALIVFGLVAYFLLTSVNMTDFITQFTIILIPIGLGFLGFAFRKKFIHNSPNKYEPNHQEYWNHIEKLRQSLENDIKKKDEKKKFMNDVLNKLNPDKVPNHFKPVKDIPDFYNIIKNSPKKTEYLQHLFTYNPSKLSLQFAIANMVEKNDNYDYRWKEDGINYFNKSFQHIYEIMSDSKPLIGLCDGCKMDYYGEDRKKCLLVLDNFHKDKNGIISDLFKD